MDFGNIPNNAQADLKAVYIINTGTPVISTQEFLCDHLSEETALHNFKVGNDGIMRATYNISKMEGNGDTIFYTQRTSLNNITDLFDNKSENPHLQVFPNPTNDFVYFNFKGKIIEQINVYNIQGAVISNYSEPEKQLYLPQKGIYVIEFVCNEQKFYSRVVRQ
jgi:hypothetical protein